MDSYLYNYLRQDQQDFQDFFIFFISRMELKKLIAYGENTYFSLSNSLYFLFTSTPDGPKFISRPISFFIPFK